jgi:hypothetical protein
MLKPAIVLSKLIGDLSLVIELLQGFADETVAFNGFCVKDYVSSGASLRQWFRS